MAIYTKTGDKGSTGNLLGERVAKDSTFIELQGSIDELNASIGYLNSLISDNTKIDLKAKLPINNQLVEIENALFNMGVEISMNFTKIKIREEDVIFLEDCLDKFTALMPPQKHFILYSGAKDATYTQVCRAIARRCERVFVKYLKEISSKEFPQSYLYINRLSDYLFTLARYVNFIQNKTETIMREWD